RRVAGKFPGSGRHAGAALVGHGYLRQDQLWPVLRAHAEWLIGRMLQVSRGTVVLEAEPPRRLLTEPSVFGGSTGAEVFVEVLRRVVSPEDAVVHLGGPSARMAEGSASSLLAECALSSMEMDVVREAPGLTVQEVLEASPDTDIATVLWALA